MIWLTMPRVVRGSSVAPQYFCALQTNLGFRFSGGPSQDSCTLKE